MIVLDASALVDLLLDQPGAAVSGPAVRNERAVHAPHLAETEALQSLRRWVRRGELTEARAASAVEDLDQMRLVLHAHSQLRRRVWSLRDRLTAYDATYLALAESLEATLVTADRGLAQIASSTVAVVHAV